MIGHHSHDTYMTLNNSCFRVARNHARIDAKRGDRFLQAELVNSYMIRLPRIACGLPTIHPELLWLMATGNYSEPGG